MTIVEGHRLQEEQPWTLFLQKDNCPFIFAHTIVIEKKNYFSNI